MRTKRKLKVYKQWNGNESVPAMILKGNWLEYFNFTIGSSYEVLCAKDCLILKTIEKDVEI